MTNELYMCLHQAQAERPGTCLGSNLARSPRYSDNISLADMTSQREADTWDMLTQVECCILTVINPVVKKYGTGYTCAQYATLRSCPLLRISTQVK